MTMTSGDFLQSFLALHPKRIDLSLSRMHRLLARLDHPESRLPPVIHVAGTNGKGSTIAFMRAILEASGQAVHVYTSPHLVRFHERIRLGRARGGVLVSEELLVDAFERCERANGGEPITVFELTTAAALLLFSEHPANVLLLEVGLGGRLDATNVIRAPLAAVITSVSRDHTEYLGEAVEQIAAEKAGIFKRGRPAIISFQTQEASAILQQKAKEVGVSSLMLAGRDFHIHETADSLAYEDVRGALSLPWPSLVGSHQMSNVATAIATLRATFGEQVSDEAFRLGVTGAQWPARLQRLAGNVAELAPDNADLWLDGSHNEDGGRVTSAALWNMHSADPRPLALVVGMLTTKNMLSFLSSFGSLSPHLIAVPITIQENARDPRAIAESACRLGFKASVAKNIADAMLQLRSMAWSRPPRVLITGSLFLAGEVLKLDGTLPS
jgi:dihydrofolate synthase/folylpolyglutamate synthase